MDHGKVRVLHVYKDFFPPVFGGIERHIHDLTTGLQKAGVETEVLVCSRKASTDRYEVEGVRIVRVAQWGRVLSAPVSPGFPLWLRRLARDKHVLHFHCPNPTGEIALLLSGLQVPVVASYHSDIVRQKISGLLYRPLLRRFLWRAARILVATPIHIGMSPHLRAFREKCTVVPFGIGLERFALTPERASRSAEIRAACGTPLVLFVGKFRYYKGLPILLHAMVDVPAKLLLVGGGPAEPELCRLVRKLGLQDRVFFEGNVPDSELPSYYHACEVLVLPSTHRSEAFGIVLLEAMACRKPVVTTELGTGTSYVNQNELTGLVVPPGDAAALAAALRRLLADAALRERFGSAGCERVQREYTREQMIRRVLSVYERELERGSLRPA